MPTIKERVESNLVVFFLGAGVAGFISGIATYDAILRISGRTTIASDVLRKQTADLEVALVRVSNIAAPVQQYLIIHRVLAEEGNMARVVVRVNNLLYAYPADVAFTPVSSSMPEQKLPLPVTSDKYTISFELQLWDRKNKKAFTAKSRATPQFLPAALPNEMQTYNLLPVDDEGMYGAVKRTLAIEYSLH